MRYLYGLILGLIWLSSGDTARVCAQGFPPPPPAPMPMTCTTRIMTGIDGRARVCTFCITPSGPVEFCS